jgi:hypothetical protein
MKRKNMTVKFLDCEDAWMVPFVKEMATHIKVPEGQTTVEVYEIDERGMNIRLETVTGVDEDGYETGEEIYAYLRYWVDETWPKFCVSYCLYVEEEERERGAYQIKGYRNKGKCIPIEN